MWSDFFTLFGLPRKLGIDPDELRRRFYDWSRKFHPDFFQRSPTEEQAISLDNSALVNSAYRTLRDPISRAEYLIRLEERAAKAIPAKAPEDLLEELLEIQEALEEAKASGLDSEARRRLERERERLRERSAEEEAKLLGVGREWDALIDESDRAQRDRESVRVRLLDRMREILAVRAYLNAVIGDLSDALGEEAPANVSHRRH